MHSARPALLLPLCLTLPVATAAADSPVVEPDPLVVEYEGRITEVSEDPAAPAEYVVGNSISGRLFIDRSVPRRAIDFGVDEVSYRSDAHPSFVSGFWPSVGDGFDRVSMANDIERPGIQGLLDRFSVEDWLVGRNASLDSAQVFHVEATLHDFLDNVSLDQSFELTSADVDEPHESLTGGFRDSNLGPFAFVRFAIDRLTVKPKHCLAP